MANAELQARMCDFLAVKVKPQYIGSSPIPFSDVSLLIWTVMPGWPGHRLLTEWSKSLEIVTSAVRSCSYGEMGNARDSKSRSIIIKWIVGSTPTGSS